MRALLFALLVALPAVPVEVSYPQGTLRGFPDLSDLSGRKLADGRLVQWIDGGRLHVRLQWDFPSGRRIEESASFDQGAQLVQRTWSFEDRQGGMVRRRFEVDFDARRARGLKAKAGGGADRWDEQIDVTPGRTFAGVGFGLAVAQSALIHAHDARLWFCRDAPPQLLRAEEPLAEVGDPMVRIDVLPGGEKLQRPQARKGRAR